MWYLCEHFLFCFGLVRHLFKCILTGGETVNTVTIVVTGGLHSSWAIMWVKSVINSNSNPTSYLVKNYLSPKVVDFECVSIVIQRTSVFVWRHIPV